MPRTWLTYLTGLGSTLAVLLIVGWPGPYPIGSDQPVVEWLADVLADLTAVLTGDGSLTSSERLGFGILLLICFAAWRGHRKALLAYRPGPVDVHEFTDATPDHSAPVSDVKSRLCQRLSETRLFPPHATVADPPTENLLDVAGGLGGRSTHPVLLALRLLSRLWPRIGYRVTGVLQIRVPEPRYGICVTVTSFLGGGRSAMTTEWGHSWEEVTTRTAHWVLATILPVTRLARSTPWRRWRGRELPAALYGAWYRGRELHQQRHFDEALWHYGEALRLDPGNAQLRLLMASVQEEMALFLHALETYHGALVLNGRGGWAAWDLWSTRARRPHQIPGYLLSTLRHLRRHRECVELRYRYACALAHTERIIPQWFATASAADDRNRVRQQLVQRLEQSFVEHYWPIALTYADKPGEEAAKDWLRTVLRGYPEAAAVVFRTAAAQELYRLCEDLAWLRFVPGADGGLTPSVLRLLRDVWAPLRLAGAWHDWRRLGWLPVRLPAEATEPVGPYDPAGCLARWWRPELRQRAARLAAHWPCPVEPLRRSVEAARAGDPSRSASTPTSASDAYHAACVYGFALTGYLPPATDPTAPATTTNRFLLLGRRLIMYSLPSVPSVHRGRAQDPVAEPSGAVPAPRIGPDGMPTPGWSDAATPQARSAPRTGEQVAAPAGRPSPPGGGPAAEPVDPAGWLADQAIRQLRASVAGPERPPDTDRMCRWTLRNGPDLAPLRRFRGPVAQPPDGTSAFPLPVPDELLRARLAVYVRELVWQTAWLLAEGWHDRGLSAQSTDPHLVIHWLDLDVACWASLTQLADDRGRFWRDRVELLQLLRRVADPVRVASAGFPPPVPPLADLLPEETDGEAGAGEDRGVAPAPPARATAMAVAETLATVPQEIAGPARDGALRVRRRLATLELRGGQIRPDEVREICARQGGRWQQVAQRMRQTGR